VKPQFADIEPYLRAQLQDDATSLIAATVILTMAVLAIAVHFLRRKSGERLLLWFGLSAGLYGVRMLSHTWAAVLTFGGTERLWRFVVAFVDYAILIPFVLAVEEIYGRGWKSSVRVLVWLFGAYAVAACTIDVILGQPSNAPDPAAGLLVLLPLIVLANRVSGYQPPPMPERPLMSAGLAVFVLTVVNEHLVNANALPWRWRIEPVGFLFFTACLGYAGVRRFVAKERRLVSLDEEMKAATRIQSSILPLRVPATDHIRLAARYAPMTAVAGDFYEFMPLGSASLGVLVADVAGHGVPAALVASILKGALSARTADAEDPATVLAGLNQTMCRQSHGQLVTAAYLFVDGERRRVRYCSAGHPPLLLLRAANCEVEELTANSLLLGVRPDEVYTSVEFGLEAGDRLVLYTDGVFEAASSSGEVFGYGRFKKCILSHRHGSCDDFTVSLLAELEKWTTVGRRPIQSDDVTVIAIEYV